MLSREGTACEVLAGEKLWHIGHGDALALLQELADESADSLVTDPPAGINFMGRDWDNPYKYSAAGPGAVLPHLREREIFIWWLTQIMRECYRVLKPGAHGLCWSLPRTSHWTGMAIENAGFEIIDQVDHIFSQGPNKSKSARKLLALENCELSGRHFESSLPPEAMRDPLDHLCTCAYPETEWDGYYAGVSPAHEDWWLFRKPLEGTIAENIMKWGTGVLDIESSRIPVHGGKGRFPKDLVLSHAEGCRLVGTHLVSANPSWDTAHRDTEPSRFTGKKVSRVRHTSREGEPSAERRYTGRGSASFSRTPGERRDAVEEVDVWECEEGCAVYTLAEQGGDTRSGFMKKGTMRAAPKLIVYGGKGPVANADDTHGDTGPVTRFFMQLRYERSFVPFRYQAKPPRHERDAGLEHFRRRSVTGEESGGARNIHTTTKSDEWMRYLVGLACPPRGVVLDPFVGSGTTIAAAVSLGRRAIGYELLNTDEEPHVEIARARVRYAEGASALVPRESLREGP